MTELKPVPSGYDSSALSSMLGYLANARKSHDNNPFMRTILDQQARDNKAEYLADADLTRNAQADDNEYAKRLNVAQLLQKAENDRAVVGERVHSNTGGMNQPLAEYLNMDSHSSDTLGLLADQYARAKGMAPDVLNADIDNKEADTENTQLDSVIKRTEVGDTRNIDDITKQRRDVNIDLENSLRMRTSAATGRDAVVKTNTEEEGREGLGYAIEYTGADGKPVQEPITTFQAQEYASEEGKKKLNEQRARVVPFKGRTTSTDQTRTTESGNGGQATPPKTRYISDEDQVRAFLSKNGIAAQEIGRDSEGIFAIVIEDGVKKTKRFE